MKFRKKPVTIDAKQFHRADDPATWPEGVFVTAVDPTDPNKGNRAAINTLEGPLTVSDGDWIITGVKGERYPCKPDIFEATYEPAE